MSKSIVTRRLFLLGSTALVACSTAPAGLAQGIADLQGAFGTLTAAEPVLKLLFPKVVTPQVMTYIDLGSAALNALSSDSPVALTNMQAALTDLNIVLKNISSVAGAVASADPETARVAAIVEAVIALAPEAEALVTRLVAATTPVGTASAHAQPLALLRSAARPRVTPAQARVVLRVRTV